MRKLIRTAVAAIALTAAFGLVVPSPALAVGYEDSMDDCAYPKVFDGLVLKPLGFATLVVGSAVGVLAVPFYPFMHRDVGKFWSTLTSGPAHFTFARPLGACSNATVGY
jgi:hypothetical protein